MAYVGNNTHFETTGGVLIDGVRLKKCTLDTQGTADSVILDQDADTTIGADTDDQIDIEVSGADDFTFTANSFNVLSGSAVAADGSTFMPFIPIAAQQALTSSAAANLTSYYTTLNTTGGAKAYTLADGVVKGQLKKVQMIIDGGTGTLTPTNLDTWNYIEFDDVGDFVLLMFDGTNWVVLDRGNNADGTTQPIVSV